MLNILHMKSSVWVDFQSQLRRVLSFGGQIRIIHIGYDFCLRFDTQSLLGTNA